MEQLMDTQLGGKYSREDQGLFELKAALKAAGINVMFPMNDQIVAEHNGIELTFDPEKEGLSFYDAEVMYLSAIRNNPVHIIHNKFKEDLGYIGQSASVEMTYAILHDRPVVLLYPPRFSDKAPAIVQDIVARNAGLLHVARIDSMEPGELKNYIFGVAERPVQYDLDVKQEIEIMRTVDELLESYKDRG